MTVIAAGVVNKQSRIILSRQFTEISRVHIEALLSAFPRLLEGYKGNRQVNYIDADSMRYVYQPLEELILVLITPITSNIVEDLATLHLMGGLIPEYARDGLSEGSIEKAAFLIFMAFDEVIIGGKREDTTLEQIKVYLAMDSYEEREAKEAKQQQLEQAKRVTAEKARELREKRRTGMLHNTIIQTANNKVMMTTTTSSSSPSLGGNMMGIGGVGLDSYVGIGPVEETNPEKTAFQQLQQRFSEFGNNNSSSSNNSNNNYDNTNMMMDNVHPMPISSASGFGFDSSNNNINNNNAANLSNMKKAAAPRSAMTLGKANKADVMSKVQKEMGFTPSPPLMAAQLQSSPQEQQQQQQHAGMIHGNAASMASNEGFIEQQQQQQEQQQQQQIHNNAPVVIRVQESMSATLSRGDEPVPVELKGEMSVLIQDPQATSIQIALDELNNREFTYRCHARVNKSLFNAQHVIASVGNKPLPLQQEVTLLRWRLTQPGSIQSPLTFECWPEAGSITIEYKFNSNNNSVSAIEQVQIAIPLYGVIPASYDASVGTCEFMKDHLVWIIPHIDRSSEELSNGNVEITLPHNGQHAPDEIFFPINISFVSNVSVGMVHVNEIRMSHNKQEGEGADVENNNNNNNNVNDSTPVPFAQTSMLITENLRILERKLTFHK